MILLYHRIARVESDPWSLCVTPEHFAEHLEVLRTCLPIKLNQINPSGRPISGDAASVTITFDDGYADNLYQASRLLEQYGMPATFFIATGYIGETREFWWDELEKVIFQTAQLPQALEFSDTSGMRSFSIEPTSHRMPFFLSLYEYLQPMTHEKRRDCLDNLLNWSHQSATVRESHRMMTRDEICTLAQSTLFEIGAHTVTHPKLASQSLTIQQLEIRQSKRSLEELLNRPVTSFSYPYGGREHYTAKTAQAVREAGFSRACTTMARCLNKRDTLFELPRFNITDMNGEAFERLLFS
jgi:peptidoglycan/xylan/chitin deacetylase (PgdA/CDA1 family)